MISFVSNIMEKGVRVASNFLKIIILFLGNSDPVRGLHIRGLAWVCIDFNRKGAYLNGDKINSCSSPPSFKFFLEQWRFYTQILVILLRFNTNTTCSFYPSPPPRPGRSERGGGKQIKQRKKNSNKNIFVLFVDNFISTKRKGVKFCFSPPIGWNKIDHQENKNILGEILVSLFSSFVNPFPCGGRKLLFWW